MLRPIRALIVSDAPDHAELLSALRRADFDPSWRHTSTFEGFTAALACDRFDIVFADANAQGVPATHALEVLKRSDLDIPCLVVSDVAREDLIVDMMRAGAADYLVTNNWARLAQAGRPRARRRRRPPPWCGRRPGSPASPRSRAPLRR